MHLARIASIRQSLLAPIHGRKPDSLALHFRFSFPLRKVKLAFECPAFEDEQASSETKDEADDGDAEVHDSHEVIIACAHGRKADFLAGEHEDEPAAC